MTNLAERPRKRKRVEPPRAALDLLATEPKKPKVLHRPDSLPTELIEGIMEYLWLSDIRRLALTCRRVHEIGDRILYLEDAKPYNQYALFWAAENNMPKVAERALKARTPAAPPCGFPLSNLRLSPLTICEGRTQGRYETPAHEKDPDAFKTPLNIAAAAGHHEMVVLLLQHLSTMGREGLAVPASRAARNGDIRMLDILLEYAKERDEEEAAAKLVVREAFLAGAEFGRVAVVEWLWRREKGLTALDTPERREVHHRALRLAAGAGQDEVWSLLSSKQPYSELDRNTLVQSEQITKAVNAKVTGQGSKGIVELVEKFVRLGYDLGGEVDLDKMVESALQRRNPALVALLLSHSPDGKKIREELLNRMGDTDTERFNVLAGGIEREVLQGRLERAVKVGNGGKVNMYLSALGGDFSRCEIEIEDGVIMFIEACVMASLPLVQFLLARASSMGRDMIKEADTLLATKPWWGAGRVLGLLVVGEGRDSERVKVAQLLLDNGASQGPTDVAGACKDLLPMLALRLLKCGENDLKGALFAACEQCPAVDLVKELLERGANAMETYYNYSHGGYTPLHVLCKCRWYEAMSDRVGDAYQVAKLLLDHGADANRQSRAGVTPLHLLCRVGYRHAPGGGDIIRALLEHGVDVNAQDNKGDTALGFALDRLEPQLVSILLDNGADLSSPALSKLFGKFVENPAYDSRHHETVKLLLAHGADPGVLRRGLMPGPRYLDERSRYLLRDVFRDDRTRFLPTAPETIRLLLTCGGTLEKDTAVYFLASPKTRRAEELAKALGMRMATLEPPGSEANDPLSLLTWSAEEEDKWTRQMKWLIDLSQNTHDVYYEYRRYSTAQYSGYLVGTNLSNPGQAPNYS